MDLSVQFLTEQLKTKGIRPSYQRVKVLEFLAQKKGHPTVDEIYRALAPEIPSLSKVTVYNTLHTLVDAGLLRVVEIDPSETRYDVTLEEHGHFLCERCGTIYNFSLELDQAAFAGLERFIISQKNVYLKGLCPNCQNPNPPFSKEQQHE